MNTKAKPKPEPIRAKNPVACWNTNSATWSAKILAKNQATALGREQFDATKGFNSLLKALSILCRTDLFVGSLEVISVMSYVGSLAEKPLGWQEFFCDEGEYQAFR